MIPYRMYIGVFASKPTDNYHTVLYCMHGMVWCVVALKSHVQVSFVV